MDKKLLTIQDISCVGQCSLTVALPIISACGIETCVLPSAVLSTHTTGFSGFTFHDLTDDMPSICSHWKKEGITFDDLTKAIMSSFDDYFDKINRIIKLFNIAPSSNIPMVVSGGSAHLMKINSVLSEELNIDIIDYSSNTLGAREKSYITLLGALKYSAIQPTVDQEEQVISTITRVGNRVNLKKDDLDDEL